MNERPIRLCVAMRMLEGGWTCAFVGVTVCQKCCGGDSDCTWLGATRIFGSSLDVVDLAGL